MTTLDKLDPSLTGRVRISTVICYAPLWNAHHRMGGPREHNDPPGYQSRVASALQQRRAGGPGQRMTYEDLQEVGALVVGSPATVIRRKQGDAGGYLQTLKARVGFQGRGCAD